MLCSGARNGAVPSEHTLASACDLHASSHVGGPRTLHTRPASVLILRRALGHQRAERVCGPDSDTGERAQHAIQHAIRTTMVHATRSHLLPAALAIRSFALLSRIHALRSVKLSSSGGSLISQLMSCRATSRSVVGTVRIFGFVRTVRSLSPCGSRHSCTCRLAPWCLTRVCLLCLLRNRPGVEGLAPTTRTARGSLVGQETGHLSGLRLRHPLLCAPRE